MKKTAEAVSLGHPDKTADYISSYILDRMIAQDEQVKYAVEVMVKDNTVVLGGEIKGNVDLTNVEDFVKNALREVGYDERYADIWGNYALNIRNVNVINLIGQQSAEITQGVATGWGDQGVFVGYACKGDGLISKEQYLARYLNNALYIKARESKNLGIDIKTQITLSHYGHIETVVVAIPMLEPEDLTFFIIKTLGAMPDNLIVNGTGSFKTHSSVADCGITGRKLACDFYSTAAPIGGGCPWTKDGSKADVTLNIYARRLALQYLEDNDECFVYLSSCIGRAKLPSATVKTIKDAVATTTTIEINKKPFELVEELDLNKPIFAKLCWNGLL
ncbi:MAG: methionine adenosyltransferase domain-containing protein [Acetobacter sp.]|nr:methionine adenosyltransferase domain-containing protein [Acetobacter sp.]